jgi:Na+/melibiose symporter-like transporter
MPEQVRPILRTVSSLRLVFTRRNLFRITVATWLVTTGMAFASSLTDYGLLESVGIGVGFGVYYGFLALVVMAPGVVVYLLLLALVIARLPSERGRRAAAIALSPVAAVSAYVVFRSDGGSVTELATWTALLAVSIGVAVLLPRPMEPAV